MIDADDRVSFGHDWPSARSIHDDGPGSDVRVVHVAAAHPVSHALWELGWSTQHESMRGRHHALVTRGEMA